MNRVVFPLTSQMQGPTVADLQDVLRVFLDHLLILRDDERHREELGRGLKQERSQQLYEEATGKLVLAFQLERGLSGRAHVDQETAQAINAQLEAMGFLEQRTTSPFVVSGMVARANGVPLPNVRVQVFHKSGNARVRLGEDVTDGGGRYTIRYEPLPGVTQIRLFLLVLDEHDAVLMSFEEEGFATPMELIDLAVSERTPGEEQRIDGTILLDHGIPAEQLTLRLYRRDFGGEATLLTETKTLADGRYTFTYGGDDSSETNRSAALRTSASRSAPAIRLNPFGSFEIRALRPDGQEVPLTRAINDLPLESRTALNLIAPGNLQPLKTEYSRLSAELTPHIVQMTNLAKVKENAEQQDLTMLNRTTGWDARVVAVAATAERLAADAEVALKSEHLYGLLRAGLPTDKAVLAQVEPDDARLALSKVRDAGILEMSDDEITQFHGDFTAFSKRTKLAMAAPGSRVNYGDLLRSSGLPQEAQDKFAPVYLKHQGEPAQLWKGAREAGLNDIQIRTLQLQGKVAFVTGNSDVLTARLLKTNIKDPVELVGRDLHRADNWKTELFEQADIPLDRRSRLTDADRQKLDTLIPPIYSADKVEARLDAYAEDMARKVRLSYPTQVLGQLMKTEEAFKPLAVHDAPILLDKSVAEGFRLGETPVSKFLQSHPEVRAGMTDQKFEAASNQMRTIQRLYQITPHDEAMPVLASLGITSGYDVLAYPEGEFAALFEAKYSHIYGKIPPSGMAVKIMTKARQVSSVTYNLFAIAKKIESDPPLPGLSAPRQVRESVKNELIKHFPTMESLFGSMDFCECEHCRSVLSPAAYFVDLLQFVDTEPAVWSNFLAKWKETHGNQDYPHKDQNGNPMKPYDVLIERRPDLPHISLTCENTHTALPYIDIVNEILEYYVAKGKLDQEAAHDTADATTPELLAEPQHIIPNAYKTLRDDARYPLNLPFDLWIETVRQFCEYFETPLHRLLEAVRPSDDLFAPAQTFDRAAIFMESLGLSPAEVSLFTNPDPLSKWYELYGFASEAVATAEARDTEGQRVDLNSAKALARRLGISYKEITELVQTHFVNPELGKIVLLYKLGVSLSDARFYANNASLLSQDPETLPAEDQKKRQEIEAFSQRLIQLADAYKVQKDKLDSVIQAIPFNRVLVLANPNTGCDFDLTTLQYSDGTKADSITFLRLNLFVRLWRKLGWSIEETDRALTTFIPRSVPFDGTAGNLAKQPLKTALIYLSHLKELAEQLKVGKQHRLKLLMIWSDIFTTGKQSLYAQLFLTPSILKTAPQFDDPVGAYLNDPNNKIKDHVLSLQSAFGLTGEEIIQILADAGLTINSVLSLPNVSLLFRYSLLAKWLRIAVRDLIVLKQISGLDPFKPLLPDPLATLDHDHPFAQTLEFVRLVQEVKDLGMKVEDLDYLLRHRFDETGKYRSDPETTLPLLDSLSTGIRMVRTEHAIPADPGSMSDESLRQKFGLVLPPDVIATFTAMLNGTVEFTAVKKGVAPTDQLLPERFVGETVIREVSYNATRQEQTLVYRGVLFDEGKASLKARLPKPVGANPHVPSQLFAELLDDVQQKARTFFELKLMKQPPGRQPASGFLTDTSYELLFAPPPAGLTETQLQERERRRRTGLASAFLPFLQQRLIQQFLIGTMTAHTGADPLLVESFLTDTRLLDIPGSLLDVFAAMDERKLTATFWATADGIGVPLATVSMPEANTGSKSLDGTPIKPAGSNSARIEGYLKLPADGAYRFYVELDKQNAEVDLRFSHLPNPEFLKGAAASDHATLGTQPAEFLELKAGVLYHFTAELKNLNGGDARLLLQGETLPKGSMAQVVLYPAAAIEAARHGVTLLNKALQVVQMLGLSEREIRYFLTHNTDFDNVSLSELPTTPSGDTNAEKGATVLRLKRFRRLTAYARLKRDVAGGTDDLVSILEANSTRGTATLEQRVYPLIAQVMRRDDATVKATAELLTKAPTFANEQSLWRLWKALQVIHRFGVSPESLLGWTPIMNSATTTDQRVEIAKNLKETIKARFERESWQHVAQPIFDKLRQRQRDALTSHVMHQHGFDRMEQLYEYFLIDPGMEPVVQTSRIRLAISSLQLFVQRCLLNLELKVHPSTIQSKQWEWMKRYRVWEANRKIFLFPENWLEPEFRDDKTHLFTELEGALLQGDVSSDLVEDVFLTYLKKLDELARLDLCAMHVEDNFDAALRTLHVFGRTYSQPHKYFYRRYSNQMWTPWEPVNVEIQGDHLAPVVWRDRLYLFWVTFSEKAKATNAAIGIDYKTKINIPSSVDKEMDAQLHWSEYLQGTWQTRESGEFDPPDSQKLRANVSVMPKQVFIHVSKEAYEEGEERGVYIHLSWPFNQAFYLAGRNSLPEKAAYVGIPDHPYTPAYDTETANATRYTAAGPFKVTIASRITTSASGWAPEAVETLSILQQSKTFTLLPCNNDLTALGVSEEAYKNASNPDAVKAALERGIKGVAAHMKPLFYQDNRHTFFIEPDIKETTIEEWQEWVSKTPELGWNLNLREWLNRQEVQPSFPNLKEFVKAPTNPVSVTQPKPEKDPVIRAGRRVIYDGEEIDGRGRTGTQAIR